MASYQELIIITKPHVSWFLAPLKIIASTVYPKPVSCLNCTFFELIKVFRTFQTIIIDFLINCKTNMRWHRNSLRNSSTWKSGNNYKYIASHLKCLFLMFRQFGLVIIKTTVFQLLKSCSLLSSKNYLEKTGNQNMWSKLCF